MENSENHPYQPDLSAAFEALRVSEVRALAGQLALEVMHEIRNPLEALGYLTYLAYQEADNPEKTREFLNLADEQLRTITSIARQTLSFVKDADKSNTVDLVAIAEAALRIHQQTLESKKIRLIKDFREDAITPVARAEMLQVVSNLLNNAVDALPHDGVLCLRLRKRGSEIQLTVADNGHGIPHEHSEKIFQPFFTTKAGRGTGLGLALSKRIIDSHHGKIRVRSSVRPGKSGTTFQITLPTKL